MESGLSGSASACVRSNANASWGRPALSPIRARGSRPSAGSTAAELVGLLGARAPARCTGVGELGALWASPRWTGGGCAAGTARDGAEATTETTRETRDTW